MRKYGWRRDLPNKDDLKYERPLHMMRGYEAPLVVSLRSQLPAVFDQGQTGSCVGNGTAGAYDFLELREYQSGKGNEQFGDYKYDPVSRLFVYFGGRALEGDTDQDAGCQIRDAITGLNKWGACREATWPFDETTVTSSPSRAAYSEAFPHRQVKPYRIDNMIVDDLVGCLVEGYPIVSGYTLYQSFENLDQTGIVPMPSRGEQIVGGHCMLIIGYDWNRQLFEVRNSWGVGFGDNGHVWMPFAYVTNAGLASDFWTLRA